jgi:hypothetical protein
MDELHRAIGQLMERIGGPLSFRLLLQPIMAIALAIRAGVRDARENTYFSLGFYDQCRTKGPALTIDVEGCR